LLSVAAPALAGSELEKLRGGLSDRLPGTGPLEAHARLHGLVREAARGEGTASVHDVSDGGLACALAECCAAGGLGAVIDLAGPPDQGREADALLFGEAPGAAVVAGTPAATEALESEAAKAGIDFRRLGKVGGNALDMTASVARLRVAVEELSAARERGLPDLLS
jgi:phosphoribosylformylglycinamidine synthase